MADNGEQAYNDPGNVLGAGVVQSDIGPTTGADNSQIRLDHFYKKALVEVRNAQFFQPLADVRAMPKHMGKTIKQYKYIPILDDRNVNDQGIDASGAVIVNGGWSVWLADGTLVVTGTGWVAPANGNAGYFDIEANARAAALANGFIHQNHGNLYGSSKDIGVITAKLPALTEHGGRVNRVGHTRQIIKGSIVKQGFFSEYTQESLDFDSDSELLSHITEESLVAANEMTEDNIQKDLINGAGVIRYSGAATSRVTVTGEADDGKLIYEDLLRLGIDLDNNKCPKSTKIITGSRMIDTRVINAARYLYCGSDMIQTFEGMVDMHNAPAFRSVETYAQAGNIINGEIGAVGQFRIVVVPEMMNWPAGGGAVTTNPGYKATDMNGTEYYDVFPLLVVGSGSFTTIGFQTDGKTVKFKIIHKKPGIETATAADPYGEKGHYAIKWYYGSMILRPEWIGLLHSVAAE